MNEELDALLAGMVLDQSNGAAANNKANMGAKKAKNADQNEFVGRRRVPVEAVYEGYTLRPITPTVGEKKSFAKVSKTPLPFDSVKLFDIATRHREKTGRDAATSYRDLTAKQQLLIERIIAEKMRDENNLDAIWEPYDIRRVYKEVSKSILRMERQLSHIELIVRRKDKNKGSLVGRPQGTTVNPDMLQGEIIDLSIPMSNRSKKNGGKKKGAGNTTRLNDNDIVDVFDEADRRGGGGNYQGNQKQQQNNGHFWNGTFMEENPPQQHHDTQQQQNWDQTQQQPWPRQRQQQQQQEHDNHWPQQQQQQQHDTHWPQQQQQQQQQHDTHWPQQQQQHDTHWPQQQQQQQHHHQWQPQVPPAVSTPTYEQNPFQPIGTHPEQYVDLPPTIDPRAQYEQTRPYPSYSRSRSRSHSRPRRQRSQRQSRHRFTPSMSSSEADHYPSDYTPPSTPPLEEFISAGSLHRHKGQRYYREDHRRYPDERYEIRPAMSYRILDVEERQTPRRSRPVVLHDDYPGARRRLINFAESQEDADFRRPRRDRGLDMLREDTRGRRRDEIQYLSRRHTGF